MHMHTHMGGRGEGHMGGRGGGGEGGLVCHHGVLFLSGRSPFAALPGPVGRVGSLALTPPGSHRAGHRDMLPGRPMTAIARRQRRCKAQLEGTRTP